MKIMVVSSFDLLGGAARASSRLNRALGEAGADSTMLVAQRDGNDRRTVQLGAFGLRRIAWFADELRERVALLPYRHTDSGGYEAFRLDRSLLGKFLPREIPAVDLINLHWVAGMLDFETLPGLAARAPIVWTLHDMLPITGGCHYDDGCARFLQRCGSCPQLRSGYETDLSRAIFERRMAVFERIPHERLHFVAPSRWLAEQVRRSPIGGRFPASVIPNSLDVRQFSPVDRGQARASLGLPQDRVIVLFVAQEIRNRRKGVRFLLESLAGLEDLHGGLMLATAGSDEIQIAPDIEHRHFPRVDDDRRLACIFSAADALVISSTQDNLPNTMLEAMACCTPVIGFATGGIPDMVRHESTGLLVAPGSVEGLRAALRRVVTDPQEAHAMGRRARDLVLSECAPQVQAERYLDLFERLTRSR